MAGHAGTAHDDDIGPVKIPQFGANRDHPRQRSFTGCCFGDRHFQRPLIRQPIHDAHLPHVADMAGN